MLTDEPVILRHPRRALARLLVVVCAAAAVFAAAAAIVAYHFSDQSMRERVEVLESDLAERRETAAEANRERDARLAQTRRDLCVVVDRVQPRDAAVQDVRRRYGCTATPPPGVSPAPSSSPPAARVTPGGGNPAGSGSGGPPREAGGRPPDPPPGPSGPDGPPGAPAPAPPPPPPAPEPEPTDLLELCVPLLNLCL